MAKSKGETSLTSAPIKLQYACVFNLVSAHGLVQEAYLKIERLRLRQRGQFKDEHYRTLQPQQLCLLE